MRHHCFREVAKMAHTCCVMEGESVSLAGLGIFPGGRHEAHSGPQGLPTVLKALGLFKGFTPREEGVRTPQLLDLDPSAAFPDHAPRP